MAKANKVVLLLVQVVFCRLAFVLLRPQHVSRAVFRHCSLLADAGHRMSPSKNAVKGCPAHVTCRKERANTKCDQQAHLLRRHHHRSDGVMPEVGVVVLRVVSGLRNPNAHCPSCWRGKPWTQVPHSTALRASLACSNSSILQCIVWKYPNRPHSASTFAFFPLPVGVSSPPLFRLPFPAPPFPPLTR